MILNIIIPMAEYDESSLAVGFPRYLWQLESQILLEKVICSFCSTKREQKFFFMVNEFFEKKYHTSGTILQVVKNSHIFVIKGNTAGAICTMLYGIDEIDENPCLVISHDQILKTPIDDFLDFVENRRCSAAVITFDNIHPKWTYVELDKENKVLRAAGNCPVSRNASTGVYYFRDTKEFMNYCKVYVGKYAGSDLPFYTNFVLNEYILNGQEVMGYPIKNDLIEFYKRDEEKSFFIPENYISKRAKVKMQEMV